MFAHLCQPLLPERIRGGWRQRLNTPPPAAPLPPPKAALRHLRNWGDGKCSAQSLIAHMSDLVDDGEAKHPMVHRLAQVDDSRGLVRSLECCGLAASIVSVPAGRPVSSIVKPSYLLNMLYDLSPDKFAEALGCADEDLLRGFWTELLPKSPELRAHPVFRTTNAADWSNIVPVTIHEDAGPVHQKAVM